MFSQQQIDEIIYKNDIADVISEYVKLERKGNGYRGLCPFHNEKTPSFSIHEGKQIFKCFGCNVSGNVVNFIMRAENLKYHQALEFLAKRVGIPIDKPMTKEEIEKERIKNDIISVNRVAARFFYNTLKNSTNAQRYLYNRGIKFDTVKKFGLGYAPEEWDALYKHFLESGISPNPKLLEKAGLITAKKDSNGYYDKFRNRIIFPIFDEMGNVIAFGGRVMDESLPKYLNSPETIAYTKGENLYALNIAKKSQSDTAIIVEGYMDCIALHKAGIDCAVASLGTALTQGQAKLLKRYFNKVVIGYDADGAGQKATERGIEILEKSGLRVKILSLGVVDKNVKDPDEFLRKHSKEEFMQVVAKSKSAIEHKIEKLAEQYPLESLESKPYFLNKATYVLAKIDDESKKEVYYKWFVEKYNFDIDNLKRNIENIKNGGIIEDENTVKKRVKRGNTEVDSKTEMTAEEIKIDKYEKTIIAFMSDDRKLMNKYYSDVRELLINNDNILLLDKQKARSDKGYKFGLDTILNDLGDIDEKKINIMTDIINKWMRPMDLEEAYIGVVCDYLDYKLKIQIDSINKTISELDRSDEDSAAIQMDLLREIDTTIKVRKGEIQKWQKKNKAKM